MYNKKKALGFRENFGNRSVGSIQFTCSFIVATILLDDCLVHSCLGLNLGFRFLQIGGSWNTCGSLEFCSLD